MRRRQTDSKVSRLGGRGKSTSKVTECGIVCYVQLPLTHFYAYCCSIWGKTTWKMRLDLGIWTQFCRGLTRVDLDTREIILATG